jgi:hypothetical protein
LDGLMFLAELVEFVRSSQSIGDPFIADDSAIAHHNHALGITRDIEFVRHHRNRHTALVQTLEDAHDFDARGAVEISGGLVRKQQSRIVHKGACDRDALLLAAGELAGMMLGAIIQANALEGA